MVHASSQQLLRLALPSPSAEGEGEGEDVPHRGPRIDSFTGSQHERNVNTYSPDKNRPAFSAHPPVELLAELQVEEAGDRVLEGARDVGKIAPAYRPLKLGARFSAHARGPSIASSVPRTMVIAASISSRCS